MRFKQYRHIVINHRVLLIERKPCSEPPRYYIAPTPPPPPSQSLSQPTTILPSLLLCRLPREMENISRGPTFGHFVTIRTERSMQVCKTTDYRVQEYRLPSPPSFKCNVLRESLSVDSQNIPCATLKRRGSWVIFIYFCACLF